MTEQVWQALIITLQLAGVTTAILMVLGLPLAWKLSSMTSRVRPALEALVALPMVLPPTVLGFYLLVAFSPNSLPGQLWQDITGSTLAFSFSGLVLASVFYSLPFVVQPLQRAFEQLDRGLLEAAATLGASPLDRFFSIVLPQTFRPLLLAASLGFAHTVGEFGVVLMIGGNIPGETQVLSIALYDAVETQDFASAHLIAGGLIGFALVLLTALYTLDRRPSRKKEAH
ncbi:molybdate ABC transporter permease subunit [Parendozoicomonas haliclonae]|uniref:Molybdenum transport system permease n=1 Tax=Parendozoicomonas haliclonae TaxID=1960125 RepID=A0A1X7AEI0_9GAMM|nr:molybdate ABC transporter permease subunit [Parendozoicomonas haliclonae]SMA34674.1 Molybdenum transport system permease protein ModB [Parendozoicomonas haliclonae]